MRVRRGRPEDVDAVVRLWRGMWDYHAPLDPRFQSTPAAEVVMSRWYRDHLENDRSALWVAEEAPGDLEGYCLAVILENPPVVPWPLYGYLSEISVRGRGRGVGKRLLEAAHGWFREQGIPYVEVSVSVKNEGARRFWRRHGYAEFLERLRLELG
jgi:ribosomal protein S18 acetylase RimI-like enzyme